MYRRHPFGVTHLVPADAEQVRPPGFAGQVMVVNALQALQFGYDETQSRSNSHCLLLGEGDEVDEVDEMMVVVDVGRLVQTRAPALNPLRYLPLGQTEFGLMTGVVVVVVPATRSSHRCESSGKLLAIRAPVMAQLQTSVPIFFLVKLDSGALSMLLGSVGGTLNEAALSSIEFPGITFATSEKRPKFDPSVLTSGVVLPPRL